MASAQASTKVAFDSVTQHFVTAIERWQRFTGADAVLADTGETFAELKTKKMAG